MAGACLLAPARHAPIYLHPETQHQKPYFQYNLYHECGFLYFISRCSRALCTARYSYTACCYPPTRALVGASYEMPGTHPYSGTGPAVVDMRCPCRSPRPCRHRWYLPLSSYALSVRYPILGQRRVLPACGLLPACCVMPGTDLAYGATRLLCDVRY
eukprot:396351-Rhodomonas_salina.2